MVTGRIREVTFGLGTTKLQMDPIQRVLIGCKEGYLLHEYQHHLNHSIFFIFLFNLEICLNAIPESIL